jgi:hypothetical protein
MMLLRTLRHRTAFPIIVVGNLDDLAAAKIRALGATYIDERDLDLSGRMPAVSWKQKFRDVGWYRQMFIRLSIDRFVDAEHVVILDSEVFVFDNWDERRLYEGGRLKSLYWIPAKRKSDWDYMMYRGAAFLIQHLTGCERAMEYASSNEFRRHISGVVLFSRTNVQHLWRRLENECDLPVVLEMLFEREKDLAFSDHDLYGIAVDLGLFDEIDLPAPVHDLLGWYDRHDDATFEAFRENAMWSMCQDYTAYSTAASYFAYAKQTAESLGRRLPEIPYWNEGDRALIDDASKGRRVAGYFDKYRRQLDRTFRRRFTTMSRALQLAASSDTSGPVIVEIGTLRDATVGGGHSTFKFGEFCERFNGELHSVDISPEAIEFSMRASADYLPWITHHVSDSTAFLRSFPARINLLYLDGLDSTPGREAEASAKQLDEIEAALPRLADQAIVLLDDADLPGEGKTRHSSRFLAEHGFVMLEDRYQRLFYRGNLPPKFVRGFQLVSREVWNGARGALSGARAAALRIWRWLLRRF